MRLRSKLFRFSSLTLSVLAALVLLILSLCSLFLRASVAMDASEAVSFQLNGPALWLLAGGVLLALFCVQPLLERVESRKLFWTLAAAYTVLAAYLILHVDPVIRADAELVLSAARNFEDGVYSAFAKGGYMDFYPHQLGLMTFERFFAPLSDSPAPFFWLNFLLVLTINFTQWKLSELLFPSPLIDKYTILLSFLFLPQLFFILFVYGTIPGLCLLLLAVYCAVRYMRLGKLRWLVLSALCAAGACLTRSNCLIGVIALVIVCLLYFFKTGRRRAVALAVAAALLVLVSGRGLEAYYREETGMEFGPGIPKTAYITMGTQESARAYGWFNSYTKDVYRGNGFDSAAAREQAQQDLAERMAYFGGHLDYAAGFYAGKILSTWCEPTFQSVWTGPLADCGQQTHSPLLRDLYAGGDAYSRLEIFLNALSFLIYAAALVCLVRQFIRREPLTPELCFPYLYFLGGFLFHILWETKSQYTYPYVYVLIPMAASALAPAAAALRTALRRAAAILRAVGAVLRAAVEPTPTEKPPAEEISAEGPPAEELPAEDTPQGEGPSAAEAPAEEVPAEDTPQEGLPAGEETPTEADIPEEEKPPATKASASPAARRAPVRKHRTAQKRTAARRYTRRRKAARMDRRTRPFLPESKTKDTL